MEMVEVSIGASHEHGVYFQAPPNRTDPTVSVPQAQLDRWIRTEQEHEQSLREMRAIYHELEASGLYGG